MRDLIWLIPVLPLLGFVVLAFGGRRLGEPFAGVVATLATGASFLVTVGVFLTMATGPAADRVIERTYFDWMPVGHLSVPMGLLVDQLSVTMALFVTGVGTLIHLYSIGYMHGDPKFSKFFVYLNLFVFSMLMLILGNSMVTTFLGWEGVGACSYFLISFWFTTEANAVAGKKAFVTNRIGDWGFMTAMFLLFAKVGTLTYTEFLGSAMAQGTATAVVLLLFVGAIGKSAQLPLYVWLPDAMAGPTPVSALIHAATMVTAGVYLMCRVSPVLALAAPSVSMVIAVVGALTALFAATVAVAQTDIKKVLAYSTVSQLGYMFLAVGSGAYVAAIFHMVTHAFFKALLFLGSGSVIHGMHDEQDMRRMGALRKAMPVTAATFIVGWLAIAGVPGLAGFFSKDLILEHAFDKSPALWAIGIVTAGLTAYYMTRQVLLVFFTKARWGEDGSGQDAHGHEIHPHESAWTMLVPLVVLAGLSIFAGYLNIPFWNDGQVFDHWLEPVFESAVHHGEPMGTPLIAGLTLASVVVGLAGIAVANKRFTGHVLRFWDAPVVDELALVEAEPEILRKAWGVDAAYAAAVDGPGRALAQSLARDVDAGGIDRAVNGVGGGFRKLGQNLRTLQTGYVRNYALGVAAGAVLLVGWFMSRASI